ncbi:MAG: Dyp-type peroxidase [Proteobacteria bacterium]|nr:Dyp-type peroxidase [Pseudomonadota bacterium]
MELDYRSTELQGVTDLTVVARIKQGAVPGALNTFTYVDRLRRVLKVLNGIRQASREAALEASPFPDSVARFRTVHFFRFAILPANDADRRPQLLLNVTVDGGWEPYMRFIWKPMGSMLDLIFCHCDDYPLARLTSFADYIAWVRDHEVVGRFFFADSGATAADSHFHKHLTDLVLDHGHADDFDARAARLAEAPREANPERSARAADIGLRALHAVAGLREYFPESDDRLGTQAFNQEHVLRRFAQDLFYDVRRWCLEPGQLSDTPAWQVLRQMFEADMAWLALAPPPAAESAGKVAPRFSLEALQAGIARPFPADVSHGALVLLRVSDAALARRWLSHEGFSNGVEVLGEGEIYQTIAITCDGMKQLGAPRAWLAGLPREFIDGMAARAGVLGDLHGNHPDHWRRPQRNWPSAMQASGEHRGAPPLDINSIDLVLQLRVALSEDEVARTAHRLAAALEARIRAIDAARDNGVEVLCVEAMRHHPRRAGEALGRDHFGYVDGVSQPSLEAEQADAQYWRDKVEPGEILLGYANNRGDAPHGGDAVLDNGSFLVVRKLRQHTELFEARLKLAVKSLLPKGDKAARARLHEMLMAKLMGRHANGKPLTTQSGQHDNDFNYRDDVHGEHCPLQSHVRRTNPREAVPPLMTPPPRIARRGMSYGPRPAAGEGDEPHGLLFMAYNASIAEQFEVIQNWVAGGSSTGLPSSQHDPLLGVPAPGRSRVYRFMHEGEVLRVDLGDTALVTLEWGLYAFAPSRAALRAIATLWDEEAARHATPASAPRATLGKACPLDIEKMAGRLKYEDETVRALHWTAVRDAGGLRHEGAYGLLVGSAEKVMMVLKDDGQHYSAAGYGPRMAETVGTFFLGQDDVGPYAGHAELGQAVNDAVEKHLGDERIAYQLARDNALAYLDRLYAANEVLPRREGASVDLIELARYVMASLCSAWFGLPDGELMRYGGRADDLRDLDSDDGKAHCPGDLMAISRYVFGPHPLEEPVASRARLLGARVKAAFAALVARPMASQKPLVRDIMQLAPGDARRQAALVAGVMLGFPAPTIGSLAAVLVNWSTTRELGRLQQRLAVPAGADYPRATFDLANEVLRQPLLDAMALAPAPYAVWRRTAPANPLSARDGVGCPVVVGLASAMRDPALEAYDDPHYLMFGGTRQRQHPLYAPHACPGYGMAMGAMLGVAAALLRAGELAVTADPRVVMLKR